MVARDLLKNIRRIQITTSRMASDIFAGAYKSVFKGRGMEFDEVREYLPGDDIRAIDWNVTARTGNLHVKKFIEERELTVMLVLDASASCRFGLFKQSKAQLAAEISSLLALSAIHNNDRVGLIIFTDRIEKFIPPRKGLKHVLAVVREALYFKPQGAGTDIKLALEYLNRVAKRRVIAFLVSDIFSCNDTPAAKKILNVTNKHHDLISLTVIDRSELSLPDEGLMRLRDSENGGEMMLDTGDKHLQDIYRQRAQALIQQRERLMRSVNIDSLNVFTGEPYVKELSRFFKVRARRKG